MALTRALLFHVRFSDTTIVTLSQCAISQACVTFSRARRRARKYEKCRSPEEIKGDDSEQAINLRFRKGEETSNSAKARARLDLKEVRNYPVLQDIDRKP